jgi:hypothetical protein
MATVVESDEVNRAREKNENCYLLFQQHEFHLFLTIIIVSRLLPPPPASLNNLEAVK